MHSDFSLNASTAASSVVRNAAAVSGDVYKEYVTRLFPDPRFLLFCTPTQNIDRYKHKVKGG